MNPKSKIYIAGHNGMVGSAIHRYFKRRGFKNIITEISTRLDLKDASLVNSFFENHQPEYVFLAAAKVGGIQANIEDPVTFFMDNIKIQNNIIESSFKHKVKRLVFLGSSCIYPRYSQQPIKEEYLLQGELEPTNESYALAKIAGLKLIEYYNRQYQTQYISVMPSNIYGFNDNFNPKNSHVLAATILKIHNAILNKNDSIEVWGNGEAKREFLFVDDLPPALELIVDSYFENSHINVGYGSDISITDLTKLASSVMAYQGNIQYNLNKPNGMLQKLMDNTKVLNLGWKPKIDLKTGIKMTYKWFLENEFKK